MLKRQPLIVGNWKMNGVAAEATELARQVLQKSAHFSSIDLVVAPVFTLIQSIAQQAESSSLGIAAQNMHFAEKGAYTGEISAKMLTSIGCRWVILGHSERRQYFGETDELINRKVLKAVEEQLYPIVCVGETIEERKLGWMKSKISLQVQSAFNCVSREDAIKVTVAYEPIWAIGTGETASPEQAQEIHAQIRRILADVYDEEIAEKIRILYGGSVNRGNIDSLIRQEDIDGALVGGASLDADHFIELATIAERYATESE